MSCVSADLAHTFDAAAMIVRTNRGVWAKLAFELSPEGRRTVVSVVTRGRSDDANGPSIECKELWLRVSRSAPVCAFHYSLDGLDWKLARLFHLPEDVISVDLISQSPLGSGCVVVHRDVQYLPHSPRDFRDGS